MIENMNRKTRALLAGLNHEEKARNMISRPECEKRLAEGLELSRGLKRGQKALITIKRSRCGH
jgi:hypothetical protein